MTDQSTPATPDYNVALDFPATGGTKFTVDLSTLPLAVRMDMLKNGTRQYIQNRLNTAQSRHSKNEVLIAWNAYENAQKADPMQSAVAKPTADKPADPDYADMIAKAVADLQAGNVRKAGDTKPKVAKDPLVAAVTPQVVRDLYKSKSAADKSFTFLKAKAEVGTDGVAYLRGMIAAKVAEGADQAGLEAMLEERYLKPARALVGQDTSKKASALPSIL